MNEADRQRLPHLVEALLRDRLAELEAEMARLQAEVTALRAERRFFEQALSEARRRVQLLRPPPDGG
jgi:uncharacterized protein YlxW (UPF0749 family)